jgi:hypothetical protein
MFVELERGIFDYHGVLSVVGLPRTPKANMTPNEELFAKFYNEEAVLVQPMNDIELDEHIHELETIAREAKARILASKEERQTRTAKKGTKAWKVEPIGPDPTVTDSINKVKQRSQRMSKLDSMRERLSSIGIADSEIEQMISKMVSKARKEPESLKTEAKMRDELKGKQEPSIITDEEKQAQIQRRKELDKQDAAADKAAKEALVHNDGKDKKALLTEEPKSPADTPKVQPITSTGKVDLSKLKLK